MRLQSFITQTTNLETGEVERGLYGEHILSKTFDKKGEKIYVIKDRSYRVVATLPQKTTIITEVL